MTRDMTNLDGPVLIEDLQSQKVKQLRGNKIGRNIQNGQAPKTFLIVLSDGEDNRGITANHYKVSSDESAFFQRVQDFRNTGLLEYLPIAYGGAVESLGRIGGLGFHAEVTDPSEIIQKFAKIKEHVMVGMPMSMGMAKGFDTQATQPKGGM